MSVQPETPQPKSDIERWLELIHREEFMGQPTGHELDGKPVLVDNFDVLCGNRVRLTFVGLEAMDPADPDYEPSVEAAQALFDSYFDSNKLAPNPTE